MNASSSVAPLIVAAKAGDLAAVDRLLAAVAPDATWQPWDTSNARPVGLWSECQVRKLIADACGGAVCARI